MDRNVFLVTIIFYLQSYLVVMGSSAISQIKCSPSHLIQYPDSFRQVLEKHLLELRVSLKVVAV